MCVLAKRQREKGKNDLHRFVFKRKEKQQCEELLQSAWKVETSMKLLEQSEKSRVQLLLEAKDADAHNDGCKGEWLQAAAVLTR